MIYQNNLFSLVRKPQKIPSTFGNQTCLLDLFCCPEELETLWEQDNSKKDIIPYIQEIQKKSEYKQRKDIQQRIANQMQQFSKEEEYGLLNRLDNETG